MVGFYLQEDGRECLVYSYSDNIADLVFETDMAELGCKVHVFYTKGKKPKNRYDHLPNFLLVGFFTAQVFEVSVLKKCHNYQIFDEC